MELIYADKNNIELGFLSDFTFDMDIGKENDFTIEVDINSNVLNYGYRIYYLNTEYGGVIEGLKVNTKAKKITYSGRTWRGILKNKIIKPTSGKAYKTVSGEANSIINDMLIYTNSTGYFKAISTPTTINIPSYSFDRYTSLLEGLNKMLKSVNARLKLEYKENGYVYIGAELIKDLSNEEEYSEDNGINFEIEDNRLNVNHLICLGTGELQNRQVVDLYLQGDGTIAKTQFYFGQDEIALVYDYPNAESLEELEKGGIEKLKENQGKKSFKVTVENTELDIGDIIGCRERVTGLYLAREIASKIIKIKDNVLSINYEVGE